MVQKVVVIGAYGKMGKEAVQAIWNYDELLLVGVVGNRHEGKSIGDVIGVSEIDLPIRTSLSQVLEETEVDVVVDLTHREALLENAPFILSKGIGIISGTTGLTKEEKETLGNLAKAHHTSIFLCSNFAIGAVLMMRFAEEACKYFPHIEILEYHHDAKRDAPSGTAMKTAERITKYREVCAQGRSDEVEILAGARGGAVDNMRIHSIRLPGYNAHQEVIFGGLGQTLTIRHDALDRKAFMPGLILAIQRMQGRTGLVEELDAIL